MMDEDLSPRKVIYKGAHDINSDNSSEILSEKNQKVTFQDNQF
jgi:hypothetical protein